MKIMVRPKRILSFAFFMALAVPIAESRQTPAGAPPPQQGEPPAPTQPAVRSEAEKLKIKDLTLKCLDSKLPPEKRRDAAVELLGLDPQSLVALDTIQKATAAIEQKEKEKEQKAKETEQLAKQQREVTQKQVEADQETKQARAAYESRDYQRAATLVQSALGKDPKNAVAQRLQREIVSELRVVTQRWYVLIGLLVLLAGGLTAMIVRLVRPRKMILRVVEGPDQGFEYEIDRPRLRVGSSADHSEIVIADENRRISRMHFELIRSGSRYFLKDFSSNGTKVNGRPVARGQLVRLRKGDMVSLADAASVEFCAPARSG